MDICYYLNYVKLMTTGDVLETELSDDTIVKAINVALQELNRYYNVSQLIYVGATGSCIDLQKVEEDNDIEINYVSNVYRTQALGSSQQESSGSSYVDPVYSSYWTQSGSYYVSTYKMYDYLSYNLMNRLQNTASTDLSFTEDQVNKKLYVNLSSSDSVELTIEIVPKLTKVEQVKGNYWIDILCRLSLAYLKIILGRVRSRYTQSNALWTQDGERLLEEGTNELKELRDRLQAKADVTYPVD